MVRSNITVDSSDLQEKLDAAIDQVQDKEMVPVLEDEAEQVLQKAEQDAPGSLSSEGMEIEGDDKFGPAALITFTEEKYYGIFPEFGTSMQREQAFLRGAADAQQVKVRQSVGEKIVDKLQDV